MKALSDIPNQDGFRAVLHRHDHSRLPIVVRLDGESYRAIDTHTGKPVTDCESWANFAGWSELPQKTPLELYLASLPPFPGCRLASHTLVTKQVVERYTDKAPKKGEAKMVAALGSLTRITLSPLKSTENKPLYLLEFWQKA